MLIADKYRQFGEVTPSTYMNRVKVTKRIILGALALMMAISVLYAPKLWSLYEDYPNQTSIPSEEIGVKMGEGYFVPQIR